MDVKGTPTMTNLTPKQAAFVIAARAMYPTASVLTRPQVEAVAASAGLNMPQWLTNDTAYRAGRGRYRLPTTDAAAPAVAPVVAAPVVAAPVAVAAAPAVPLLLPLVCCKSTPCPSARPRARPALRDTDE